MSATTLSVGATSVSRSRYDSALVRSRVAWPAVLIGAFTVGLSAGHTQDADGLTIDISQCVALATENERLSCYGRLANAAIAAASGEAEPAGGPARSAMPAAASAAAASGAARPAQTEAAVTDAARTTPETGGQAQPEESQEILSRVAELEEFIPNRYRITLENGQVWRQKQAKRYMLQPGSEVRIYPSRWGESYRLTSADVNGFIQVERVR